MVVQMVVLVGVRVRLRGGNGGESNREMDGSRGKGAGL